MDVVAHDAQAEQVEGEPLLRPREAEQDDLAGLRPAQVEGLVVTAYPSGVGRLYAEDVIVKIAGPGGTMIVSTKP